MRMINHSIRVHGIIMQWNRLGEEGFFQENDNISTY